MRTHWGLVSVTLLATMGSGFAAGTSHLSGGKTYLMGEKYSPPNKEVEFRLNSAEYTTRYVGEDGATVADRGSKLLVLHFSVRNKTHYPLRYGPGFVTLSVVTSGCTYHSPGTAPMWLGKENAQLGAGKSASESTTIEVPGDMKDPVVTVRLTSGEEFKVDLKGKVKTINSFFLNGNEAADEKPLALGEKAEFGLIDVKVTKFEDVGQELAQGVSAGPGESLAVLRLDVTNVTSDPIVLGVGSVFPELLGLKAEDWRFANYFVANEAWEEPVISIKPHATVKGQLVFRLRDHARPTGVRLTDNGAGRRSVVVKF